MSGPYQGYPMGNAGPSGGASASGQYTPGYGQQPQTNPNVDAWKDMEEKQRREVEALMAKQREQRAQLERLMRQRQVQPSHSAQPNQVYQAPQPNQAPQYSQVPQSSQHTAPGSAPQGHWVVPAQPSGSNPSQNDDLDLARWVHQEFLAYQQSQASHGLSTATQPQQQTSNMQSGSLYPQPTSNQQPRPSSTGQTYSAPTRPAMAHTRSHSATQPQVPYATTQVPQQQQPPQNAQAGSSYQAAPPAANLPPNTTYSTVGPQPSLDEIRATYPAHPWPMGPYASYWPVSWPAFYPTYNTPPASTTQPTGSPALQAPQTSVAQNSPYPQASNVQPSSAPNSFGVPQQQPQFASQTNNQQYNPVPTVVPSTAPQRTTPNVPSTINIPSGSTNTQPTSVQVFPTKTPTIDRLLGKGSVTTNHPPVDLTGSVRTSTSHPLHRSQAPIAPPSMTQPTLPVQSNPPARGRPPGSSHDDVTRAARSRNAQTVVKNLTPSVSAFLQQQAVLIRDFETLLASKPDLQRFILSDPELKSVYETYKKRPLRGERFDAKELYRGVLMPIIERKREEYNERQKSVQQAKDAAQQAARMPVRQPIVEPSASTAPAPAPAPSISVKAGVPSLSRSSAPPPASTTAPSAASAVRQTAASATPATRSITPAKDTIAHDFLAAMGLLGNKKKRKLDDVEVSSGASSAAEPITPTTTTQSLPRVTSDPAIQTAIETSLIDMQVNRGEDRATSAPLADAEGPPAKQRRILGPNYNPPPGSLAAKVAAMPNVPILHVGSGKVRRAVSAFPPDIKPVISTIDAPPPIDLPQVPEVPEVPELPRTPELPQVPELPLVPATPDIFADVDESGFSAGAMPSQVVPIVSAEKVLVPPILPEVQMMQTLSITGPSALTLPVASMITPVETALSPTSVFERALAGVQTPIAVIDQRPLAEAWRDPNVVAKRQPPPRGYVVEVVIPVSRENYLELPEERMRAFAKADPWPHPQSRLNSIECRWGDCDVVLDCFKRLKAHVMKKHVDTSIDKICQWDDCDTNCNNKKLLERHVHRRHLDKYTYRCPYEGCTTSSPTEAAWRNHMRHDHPKKSRNLRPLAMPLPLKFTDPIPPLPDRPVAPAEVLYLPVRQAPIPADFHQELGPWVLRRILGEVMTDQPRPSTAVALSPSKAQRETPMSSSRRDDSPTEGTMRSEDPAGLPPAKYRYAFLNGMTHQIINRLSPIDLDDIVRDPADKPPRAPSPRVILQVPSGRENTARDEAMAIDAAPTSGELPLFLPDDDDEPQRAPPFPDTPTSPSGIPGSAQLPLFLPDDDDDDELLMTTGPAGHGAARRLFQHSSTVNRAPR